MDNAGFSFKITSIAVFIAFCIVTAVYLQDRLHRQTKAVFCDVGQGDGAYIRTADKIDIVIDAGPTKAILTCLGKYMPFYDRTIELAFLSHPQKDHYGGYLYILDRYGIKHFILPPVSNSAQSFVLLERKLLQSKSAIRYLYAGDRISVKNTDIAFFWPERQFVLDHTRPKNHGDNNQIKDLLEPRGDLNDFSQIFVITDKKTKMLFTADASGFVLDTIAKRFSGQSIIPIDILKVPHHGSKNGLTSDFLQLADPTLSVISVGTYNPYGHPSKEVLNLLKALNKNYARTDEKGNVVIEIGDKGWNMIE